MSGREDKKANDLFFTCSLIAYLARKTKNTPADIVTALGEKTIRKIYDLADVYHSDNIDRVSEDFIAERGILPGSFDNVAACHYAVPTHWDIGKVYKRLILMESRQTGADCVDTLMAVYRSKTSALIEDYNSSFYYDNPQTIFATYQNGGIPE